MHMKLCPNFDYPHKEPKMKCWSWMAIRMSLTWNKYCKANSHRLFSCKCLITFSPAALANIKYDGWLSTSSLSTTFDSFKNTSQEIRSCKPGKARLFCLGRGVGQKVPALIQNLCNWKRIHAIMTKLCEFCRKLSGNMMADPRWHICFKCLTSCWCNMTS